MDGNMGKYTQIKQPFHFSLARAPIRLALVLPGREGGREGGRERKGEGIRHTHRIWYFPENCSQFFTLEQKFPIKFTTLENYSITKL